MHEHLCYHLLMRNHDTPEGPLILKVLVPITTGPSYEMSHNVALGK